MTTKLKMLPVRVSPALRALIDQAGPVNAATRALIILGAEAAGLDLADLEQEVAGLLAEDLIRQVQQGLRRILLREGKIDNALLTDGAHQETALQITPQSTSSPPVSKSTDDPFIDIGVEV